MFTGVLSPFPLQSPLVLFFFVNLSPALYYLNVWNRPLGISTLLVLLPLLLCLYESCHLFPKSIQGNRDAFSVVKYQLKEPFVTRKLHIYPAWQLQSFCLRVEIYGCNPNPGKILSLQLYSVHSSDITQYGSNQNNKIDRTEWECTPGIQTSHSLSFPCQTFFAISSP